MTATTAPRPAADAGPLFKAVSAVPGDLALRLALSDLYLDGGDEAGAAFWRWTADKRRTPVFIPKHAGWCAFTLGRWNWCKGTEHDDGSMPPGTVRGATLPPELVFYAERRVYRTCPRTAAGAFAVALSVWRRLTPAFVTTCQAWEPP